MEVKKKKASAAFWRRAQEMYNARDIAVKKSSEPREIWAATISSCDIFFSLKLYYSLTFLADE